MGIDSDLTAFNEGLRLSAYDDANGSDLISGQTLHGNVTAGWGLCLSKPYGELCRDEADFLLLYRLWKIRQSLQGAIGSWLSISPVRQAALADVAYNRGLGGFISMELIGSINRGDWLTVAQAVGACPAARVDPARYARVAAALADDRLTVPDEGVTLSESIRQFILDNA